MQTSSIKRTQLIGQWQAARDKSMTSEQQSLGVDEVDALHSNMHFYRDILNSLDDAVLLVDLRGTIVESNRQAELLSGLTRDELVQASLMDLVPSPAIERARPFFGSFFAGKPIVVDVTLSKHNKRSFHARVSAALVDVAGKKIARIVVHDISSRKRAEAALAKEQYLLHSLMDYLPDAIYFKDEKSQFVRASKTLGEWIGMTPAQIVGKSDFDLIGEVAATDALKDEAAIMRTGNPVIGKEERRVWPDGHESWVSTTKAPLYDDRGKIAGTFGISRDITAAKRSDIARKALEERMEHADKMESLGMLASGIAHDFNNLLMGVLGNASLAQNSLSADHPALAIVKQIETATLRAADLTNQLLAYSGRGGVPERTDANLNALVKEMASLLQVTISKNVALRYALSDSLPVIEADATQIRQVIMNLIKNASDALGENSGTITVSTGRITCDAAYLEQTFIADDLKPGEYVYLEVSDTGCGIDPETKQKLFDPFFTTKPTGRGLGLATVIGIVRGHAGTLKVYSELGKGSTFKVLLRASERPTLIREREEKEHAPVWRGSGKIIVADDEDIIRDVAGQMLSALGFDVLLAASGKEAVYLLEKNSDVIAVLLDEVMPNMDGEETFTELRRMKDDIKVILCSGYTQQDATARFAGKGLSAFIQKPFTLQILSDKLQRVLEGSETL